MFNKITLEDDETYVTERETKLNALPVSTVMTVQTDVSVTRMPREHSCLGKQICIMTRNGGQDSLSYLYKKVTKGVD